MSDKYYNFSEIEKKWRKKWLDEKPFAAITGDTSLRTGVARRTRPAIHGHGYYLPLQAYAGI